MNVTIYHNPRCSKSRQTLALLRDQGIEPNIVEYLVHPPSAAELDAILTQLGVEPRAMIRKSEDAYRSAGLDDPTLTRAQLIDAMVKDPILIERPIVVRDDARAALGRPPENVLAIL